jgi:hypothetical protein
MKIVCAWCKRDIGDRGEGYEITHGICKSCKTLMMNRLHQITVQKERTSETSYNLAMSRSPVMFYR